MGESVSGFIKVMSLLPSNHLSGPFEQLRIDSSNPSLLALHGHVLRHGGRIELTDDRGGTTVLVSKSEIEALETALELLGKTDDVRAMHIELARVAAASMNAA